MSELKEKMLIQVGGSYTPTQVANEYIHKQETPKMPAMGFGNVLHLCVLEPEKVDRYIKLVDSTYSNTKRKDQPREDFIDIYEEILRLYNTEDDIDLDVTYKPKANINQIKVMKEILLRVNKVDLGGYDLNELRKRKIAKDDEVVVEFEKELTIPPFYNVSSEFDLQMRGKVDIYVILDKEKTKARLIDIKGVKIDNLEEPDSKKHKDQLNHYIYLLFKNIKTLKEVEPCVLWVEHCEYLTIRDIFLEVLEPIDLKTASAAMEKRTNKIIVAVEEAIKWKKDLIAGIVTENTPDEYSAAHAIAGDVEKTITPKERREITNTILDSLTEADFDKRVSDLARSWASTKTKLEDIAMIQRCREDKRALILLYGYMKLCVENNLKIIGDAPDAYIAFLNPKQNSLPTMIYGYNYLARRTKDLYGYDIIVKFLKPEHVSKKGVPGTYIKKMSDNGVYTTIEYQEDIDPEAAAQVFNFCPAVLKFSNTNKAIIETEYVLITMVDHARNIIHQRFYRVSELTTPVRLNTDAWRNFPKQMFAKAALRRLLQECFMMGKIKEQSTFKDSKADELTCLIRDQVN